MIALACANCLGEVPIETAPAINLKLQLVVLCSDCQAQILSERKARFCQEER